MKLFVKTYDRLHGVSTYSIKLHDQDIETLRGIMDEVEDLEQAAVEVNQHKWSCSSVEDWMETIFEMDGGLGSAQDAFNDIKVVVNTVEPLLTAYAYDDGMVYALTNDDTSDICDHFEEECF